MDLTKTGRQKRGGNGRRVAHKRLSDPGMLLRRRTGMAERMKVRTRLVRLPAGNLTQTAKVMAANLPIAKIVLTMSLVLFASIGILLGVVVFAKSKEMSVRIENGPIKMAVKTTARTVGDLLEENNVRLGPKDEVMPAKNTRLTDGMVVAVNRAMLVYVHSNGEILQPLYIVGGTVEDALGQAKISFDQDDEISPKLGTQLTAGMRIKHVKVETVIESELQNIKYNTVYQNTSSLLKGKTQVKQNGKQGVKQKLVEVIYKNGMEVSRTVIKTITKEASMDRIILKGTGVAQRPSSGSSGSSGGSSSGGGNSGGKPSTPGNSGGSSGSGGSGGDSSNPYTGIYAHVKPEDLVIPAKPNTFEEMRYMTITAYTHTGRKTASGNWPQFTRTLQKPGSIAVNFKSIPRGTLLYVTGYGYCVAEDTGSNEGDSSMMGDVFMNTRDECYKWGRRRNVEVFIVKYNFKR